MISKYGKEKNKLILTCKVAFYSVNDVEGWYLLNTISIDRSSAEFLGSIPTGRDQKVKSFQKQTLFQPLQVKINQWAQFVTE